MTAMTTAPSPSTQTPFPQSTQSAAAQQRDTIATPQAFALSEALQQGRQHELDSHGAVAGVPHGALPGRAESWSQWLLRSPSQGQAQAERKRWGGLPCLRGRYVIHSAIAKGPTYQVYRAWDIHMEREVALKAMVRQVADSDADWDVACQRFAREALLMMMAQQPLPGQTNEHVVQYYGLIRTPKIHYIAMEYVEGVNLRGWMERHRPDAARLREIATGIGQGLAQLHAAGLVHRDLKPENVMITPSERVVLIDLGIAYQLTHGYLPEEVDLVRGTPGYLAPEQLHCQPLSPATDMYALGAVMYELMTGTHLFQGNNTEQLLMAQMLQRLPSMATYERDPAWRDLVPAIQWCLQEDPTARPSTFAALQAVL